MQHGHFWPRLGVAVAATLVTVAACFGPPPQGGNIAPLPTQTGSPTENFMAWVLPAQESFHVHLAATDSEVGVGWVGTEDLDIVGQDYSGTIDIKYATKTYEGSVVLLHGIAYAKLPGKAWQRSAALDLLESPDPFANILRQTRVYDMGAETRTGTAVEHLRITDWLFGDPSLYLGLPNGDAHVVASNLDVWVTPDGKPVAAEVNATVTDISSGDQIPDTIHQEYTITGTGTPITIKAPI